MNKLVNGCKYLNLSVEPLPDSSQFKTKRSMITVSGFDRLGLVYGVSSILGERRLNVQDCSSRKHQDLHGAMYVVGASVDEVKPITPDEVLSKCDAITNDLTVSPSGIQYKLSAIVPDSPGVLSTLTEFLFRKKIHIMENEAVTFETKGPGSLCNQSIVASSITLSLDFGENCEGRIQDLVDGLDYLESRYRWYLKLDKRTVSKPKPKPDTGYWFDRAFSNAVNN